MYFVLWYISFSFVDLSAKPVQGRYDYVALLTTPILWVAGTIYATIRRDTPILFRLAMWFWLLFPPAYLGWVLMQIRSNTPLQ